MFSNVSSLDENDHNNLGVDDGDDVGVDALELELFAKLGQPDVKHRHDFDGDEPSNTNNNRSSNTREKYRPSNDDDEDDIGTMDDDIDDEENDNSNNNNAHLHKSHESTQLRYDPLQKKTRIFFCCTFSLLLVTLFTILFFVLLDNASAPSPTPSLNNSTAYYLSMIDALASTANIKCHLRALTLAKQSSHSEDACVTLDTDVSLAGTPQSSKATQYVYDKMKEYGISVKKKRYSVLLSYPISHSLSIVDAANRSIFNASLTELPVDGDDTSKQTIDTMTYNAYSKSGIALSSVVYVNYGTRRDFELLYMMGVSLEGKIALVRYGHNFRGVKVMMAQAYGAAGVIIYSDPTDDGYVKGAVYPNGPYRPSFGVQRGSIAFLPLYPGDPLTPSTGAELPDDDDANVGENGDTAQIARKYTPDNAPVLTKLPVLPISYGDASEILKRMSGTAVNDSLTCTYSSSSSSSSTTITQHVSLTSWQGGLPFIYHIGAVASNCVSSSSSSSTYSPLFVRLEVVMNTTLRTITNVIGEIPADEASPFKNRTVVIGNHRDAWNYGAIDPHSGTATLLELVRIFSVLTLAPYSWRPLRSLLFASWDAEEFGLIGSTEWCESNSAYVRERVVAYVNVDMSVGGTVLDVSATPSLSRFVMQVAKGVRDVKTNASVFASIVADAMHTQVNTEEVSVNTVNDEDDDTDVSVLQYVHSLGSGTDFSGFIHHLGVPSIDLSLRPRSDSASASGSNYSVYHSIYDDYEYASRYLDVDSFTLLCRAWGHVTMQLVQAEKMPFRMDDYANSIVNYTRAIIPVIADLNSSVSVTPIIDVASHLVDVARSFNAKMRTVTIANNQSLLVSLNDVLSFSEQKFILPAGMPFPHRIEDWYRHVIFASSLYGGYSAEELPGLNNALTGFLFGLPSSLSIVDRDTLASQQVALIINSIHSVVGQLHF